MSSSSKLINLGNFRIVSKKASLKRSLFLVLLCFFVYFMFLTVLPGNERVIVCAADDNACTGIQGDTGSAECTAYGTCNGGPGWALNAGDCTGDASCASTTCCGDDDGEAVVTEASGTDAPGGYNNGVQACCNIASDCNYDGTCVANASASAPSIPNKAYCGASSTWYGGDASEAACTAIVGADSWNIGGEINATVCCGDDSGENKNFLQVDEAVMEGGIGDNTSDNACCLASDSCVNSSTCYDEGASYGDIDGDGDNDYCENGIWKDCNSDSDCTGLQTCSLASNNCVDPEASITIRNLGVTGFDDVNQEYTSQRAVLLQLTFESDALSCRYTNFPNATTFPVTNYSGWTGWESCVSSRAWELSSGLGLKTVFYQINYTTELLAKNDTIYYNTTGAGLDTTAPTSATINDGDYTNNNQSVNISWSGASDSESTTLGIPLQYRAVIYLDNGTTISDSTTTSTSVNVSGLNMVHNTTIYVNLSVINSAGLTANSTSDGLVVDLEKPTISSLIGTFKNISTNNYQLISGIDSSTWVYATLLNYSWSGQDTLSGIDAFSYVLAQDSGINPDNIPEGDITNLAGETDKTYTGLKSGTYYFKLKARDNAGNWGDLSSLNISIDNSPGSKPEILTETKLGSNVTYTWSASSDGESGIINYMINLTDDNDVVIDSVLVNDTESLSHKFSGVASGTYNSTVGALNGAGIWRWSNQDTVITDFDPPTISFTPNKTVLKSDPILRVWTNEQAICYYNISGGGKAIFSYTNTTYHEKKVSGLANGENNYVITCDDEVGNEASETFSFTVNSSAAPDSIGGPSAISTYQNLITTFEVNLTDSGTVLTGTDSFTLYIDDVETEVFVFDKGDGIFNVSFSHPGNGSYELRLAHGDAELNTTLNISELYLNASYDDSTISGNSEKTSHIHYVNPTSSRRMGLATDTDTDLDDYISVNNRLEVPRVSIGDNLFIFNTQIRGLNDREKKLDDGNFLDSINPSFGYSIQDVYIVQYILRYDDFAITSDIGETLDTGEYNALIRNTLSTSGDKVLKFSESGSESGRVTLVE